MLGWFSEEVGGEHQAHFVDLDWTPGLNVQAEDRLCRIGQRNSVLITRLVADVSLDRRVSAALARKGKLIEAAGLAASDAEERSQ